MDIGNSVSIVIYIIFFLMTIIYFYLFRKDRFLIHLYFSLIPTFLCICLLMNYHHYQPIQGAWVLGLLMLVSILSCLLYWLIHSFWKNK
ncbi:hypothetical protein CF160_03935 [Enterococcus pseudoavium]|nr:hypothetical protein CF160_03935 [Enterococcus pseudoavium]